MKLWLLILKFQLIPHIYTYTCVCCVCVCKRRRKEPLIWMAKEMWKWFATSRQTVKLWLFALQTLLPQIMSNQLIWKGSITNMYYFLRSSTEWNPPSPHTHARTRAHTHTKSHMKEFIFACKYYTMGQVLSQNLSILFCLTLMSWTGAPYVIHYLHNTCKKKCTPTTATWAHKGLKAKILIFCHCITLYGLQGLLSVIKGRSMYLIFINI